MDKNDFERFEANRHWLNQFFTDLKQLFDKIGQFQANEFSLPQTGYYYPKQNFVPGIPPYYVMGQGGSAYSIEVYAIIAASELENQTAFASEPSIIIVKQSRGHQWLNVHGLRVIHNDRITSEQIGQGVIAGLMKGDNIHYQAFQVPLSVFTEGQNINDAIQTEIIEVLNRLPDFSL